MAYPRDYPTEDLEKEIDKYGNTNPNIHLGPSYYARASLGLTELERRSTKKLGWWSFGVSVSALFFSVLAVLYAREQTKLTEIQSVPEKIRQLRWGNEAIEHCKRFPEYKESGLYSLKTGEPISCPELLKEYNDLN